MVETTHYLPLFSMKYLLISAYTFYLCAVLCFVSSCDNEVETLNIDYGFTYFPIDSGHWVIYQVDSVIYSKFLTGGKDTVSAQLKEVLAGTFIDNAGREARKIERYVRHSPDTDWETIAPTIWYGVSDSTHAERMEGDLRFIKMVFPVTEGKQWAGNLYINTNNSDFKLYRDWEYVYTNLYVPATVNAQLFDGTPVSNSFANTVMVSQTTREDNDNLVEFSYSTEQYAEGVGMIFKELWLLELGGKPIEDPTPWPDRAETGFVTVYRLIDYKH